MTKREWNTPIREPWNPIIRHLLHGIDHHVRLYLATGDVWHLKQADLLRSYVVALKEWINQQERG
jgi:hypothetical protein